MQYDLQILIVHGYSPVQGEEREIVKRLHAKSIIAIKLKQQGQIR